jgi:hypothetical protein
MLWDSITLDSVHGHCLTVVNLGKGPVSVVVSRCHNVNIVAVTCKTGCKALGESSRTIDVWRECVTANHNGQWLISHRF